jgi:hypothetical protein
MRGALLIVVGFASIASAEPVPKPVDIKPYKNKLVVLKDADGGVYAVTNEKGEDPHIFYGANAKVLYEQLPEGSSSRNGDVAWSVAVMAPRTPYPFIGQIERKEDGSYRRACGEVYAELTELTGDKAKEILGKAQFLTTTLIRRPYLLARDDRGVYYYVDELRQMYGGAGHRVFVGKKGALKQMALTDVTSDSAGEVFSTKSGDLRLVHSFDDKENRGKPSAQWIRGEKKTDLINLDPYMNQPLIWRDFGIYKIPGSICGNI